MEQSSNDGQPLPDAAAASAPAVKQLFLDAIAIDDRAGREAFVREACQGDGELEARLRSLLDAHGTESTLLNVPLIEQTTFQIPIDEPGDSLEQHVFIGPYELIRELGEGGFGVVWEVQQHEPISRRVALKLLRRDWIGFASGSAATREALARFHDEQKALARLHHPGIAQVYDAGVVDAGNHAGQPYYAMELVAGGETVPAYCDRRKLSLPDRVALFADIADAVHHAHTRGVLHRDLKPANILVAEDTSDDEPVARPKIIDFGIAQVHDESADRAIHTRPGNAMGTPLYAAPEQLAGNDADTRSDVFSLGAVLYELLTSLPPRQRQPASALLTPTQVKLQPMSKRLAAESSEKQGEIAGRRHLRPDEMRRKLSGELHWIVQQATADEPEDRYQSAAAMAADLRRWLRGEPLLAAPPGRLYLAKKFIARHRAAVAASVVVLMSVVGGTLAAGVSLWREAQAATEARHQAEVAQAVTAFFTEDVLAAAKPSPRQGEGTDVTLREVLDAAAAELASHTGRVDDSTRLRDEPQVRSAIQASLGDTYAALGDFTKAVHHFRLALAAHEATDQSGIVASEREGVILSGLGSALHNDGHLDEAARVLRQSTDLLARHLPGNDARRLLATQRLASCLSDLGHHGDAEQVLTTALAELESAGGLGDLKSLEATRLVRHQRAMQMAAAGDFDGIERLYRAQLDDCRRLRGTDDMQTLSTQVRLGEYLLAAGNDPAASEQLLLDAIDRLTRIAGADHPTTLDAGELLELARDRQRERQNEDGLDSPQ